MLFCCEDYAYADNCVLCPKIRSASRVFRGTYVSHDGELSKTIANMVSNLHESAILAFSHIHGKITADSSMYSFRSACHPRRGFSSYNRISLNSEVVMESQSGFTQQLLAELLFAIVYEDCPSKSEARISEHNLWRQLFLQFIVFRLNAFVVSNILRGNLQLASISSLAVATLAKRPSSML